MLSFPPRFKASLALLTFVVVIFSPSLAPARDFSSLDIMKLKVQASMGDWDAQKSLGAAYSNDNFGIPKDRIAAIKWYSEAEASNDYKKEWFQAELQSEIGDLYREGNDQDKLIAIEWFEKVLRNGDALDISVASKKLGYMYRNGEGVQADKELAIKYFTRSAELDNHRAQFVLGYMYCEGEALVNDFKAGLKWTLKAAEGGVKAAQYNLGVGYIVGDKCTGKDHVLGYMWMNILSNLNYKDAEEIKNNLSTMSPADISKAQKLSQECITQNYKDCGH